MTTTPGNELATTEPAFEHNIADEQKTCAHNTQAFTPEGFPDDSIWGTPVHGAWDRKMHQFCSLCGFMRDHV